MPKQAKQSSLKSAGDADAGARAVDAYLARVPEPARSILGKTRTAIRSAAPPEATEKLSYGMPAFHYKGALVAYAAFKDHCSFFPMSGRLLDSLGDEVAAYRTARGTLQFPPDRPLPTALVKKMVKARLAENRKKKS